MNWKDVTSYGQKDTEREPRVWECMLGEIDVKVHRYLDWAGWFLTSRHLDIHRKALTDAELADCQKEAIEIAKAEIEQKMSALSVALGEINETNLTVVVDVRLAEKEHESKNGEARPVATIQYNLDEVSL